MEKELFISSLKEKSGVDNLSERTIDEVANLFLPSFTEDKEYSDDDWKMPVQMVKTMSGQLRHDMSTGITNFKTQFETENKTKQQKAIEDAIAAAKAEWEKANPKPATPPATPPADKDLDTKIAEAIAKATEGLTGDDGAIGKLSKQFSEYMAQVAAEKKATTEASIREQVRDYLLSRGVDEDDFALDYTLEKLAIGDNPDVTALKAKAEKDYEAAYKRIHKTDTASPFNGNGGKGGDSTSDFNEYIKQKKAEAEREAKDAEALKGLMC